MKTFRFIIVAITLISSSLLLVGCIDEERFPNTPLGNFEELWKIIDERYCFLEYKNIDWNNVYTEYKNRILIDMNEDELFTVLSEMLEELEDGHVNLYFDKERVSYFWQWFEKYPRNFNEAVQHEYLGPDYLAEGNIIYKILKDNIGYMYCGAFTETITNEHLDNILLHMVNCRGIIIDIRDNGGGSISNSTRLASRFTENKVLTGYLKHKTGKGWNDFSSAKAIYLEPSNNIRWNKKTVVLTNRHAYSAANDFTNTMKCLPSVTIIGDSTGGGSGLPFTSELPNGWSVRFSASPHFDANMNHIEFGIEPDIKVDMTSADESKGIDSIIEAARFILKQ